MRHAELILPLYVERDPLVRDVLAELLTHAAETRSAGSCKGWPTELAYRCNPSGCPFLARETPTLIAFTVDNRDQRTCDTAPAM